MYRRLRNLEVNSFKRFVGLTAREPGPFCVGIDPKESADIHILRREFGKGDARKQKRVKTSKFQSMRARHSVNEGFGKEFSKGGNSVKKSGRLSELVVSESLSFLCSFIPFPNLGP